MSRNLNEATIGGSIPAIVTPMQADGAVDEPAFRALLDWHIESGSDAIVAVGTTGESATLSVLEHEEVIGIAVDQIAGRVPLIAGTGANSTAEAIHLTKSAQNAGANACLHVTPYYNKPTQEGLYLHFRTIAEAVPVPIILYNVPGRTACDMQNDTVLRLAQIDNIIGLKDATSDVPRGIDLIDRAPADFSVYSGEDISAMELMLGGGRGTISVTANVAPTMMHKMCAAAVAGDRDTATRLNDQLEGLHTALFSESNPIPSKWALHQMGFIAEGIRLPLTPLASDCHQAVLDAMKQAGVAVSDQVVSAIA